MQHLQDAAACVATKGLTHRLSSLDATFTKNTGGGVIMVNQKPEERSKGCRSSPWGTV